jgi:hypothetical protein
MDPRYITCHPIHLPPLIARWGGPAGLTARIAELEAELAALDGWRRTDKNLLAATALIAEIGALRAALDLARTGRQ